MTLAHKAFAELAGTFAVIFVGGGTLILSERFPNLVPSFCVPVSWGLIVCLMILVAGKISGAHFNPAVTLAFAVAKKLPPIQVLIYWGSQFIGGVAAVLLLMALQKT